MFRREVTLLEIEVPKDLRVKMVKSFMEIFILVQLRENAVSGYDIIASIHEKFGVMVSSGTVYTRIYRMERQQRREKENLHANRKRQENHRGCFKREKTDSRAC